MKVKFHYWSEYAEDVVEEFEFDDNITEKELEEEIKDWYESFYVTEGYFYEKE